MEKLKKGYRAAGRMYKNHIDGYNLLPYLTGEVKESPRNFFFYFSDDGDVLGLRFDNWKIVFMEQRLAGHPGRLGRAIRQAPATQDHQPADRPLRVRAGHVEHLLRLDAAQRLLHLRGTGGRGEVHRDLQEFPAIQKPNSFTVDDAMAKMSAGAGGG